jgi:hypothetical protein
MDGRALFLQRSTHAIEIEIVKIKDDQKQNKGLVKVFIPIHELEKFEK